MASTDHLWRPWRPNDAPVDLTIAGADGIEIIDQNGKRYMDAQAAYSGASCGYSVPAIVEALWSQARTCPNYPLDQADNGPALDLARRISDVLPHGAWHVFFCCSGSDAVEAAVKMARLYQRLTGSRDRRTILTLPAAYHGATLGALAASDIAHAREGFEPFPGGFERLPTVDVAGLDATMRRVGRDRIAALIAEPVRGVGGVHVADSAGFRDLSRACRDAGILVIVDEILTGYGRTGRWFAFEHWDLQPDIVTMEKGMTGGYVPLAAVAARPAIFDAFEADPILHGFRHGHTFGGHPVACAAGVATIDHMLENGLVENAARIGSSLRESAARLRRHAAVADVRGLGLLVGVEFHEEAVAARVQRAARESGLLVRHQRRVITLAPPLCIAADQAVRMIDIVDAACVGMASAALA